MWYDKATEVRQITSKLYQYVDSLKKLIVVAADGEDGDINNIRRRDDLEAAAYHVITCQQARCSVTQINR